MVDGGWWTVDGGWNETLLYAGGGRVKTAARSRAIPFSLPSPPVLCFVLPRSNIASAFQGHKETKTTPWNYYLPTPVHFAPRNPSMPQDV